MCLQHQHGKTVSRIATRNASMDCQKQLYMLYLNHCSMIIIIKRKIYLVDTPTEISAEAHYSDVIRGSIAFQITSLRIVYSIVYSGADQRKHQSFASLAFVRGIHRRQVNSPHKGPATRKMFPFDDVIMLQLKLCALPCYTYTQCRNIRHCYTLLFIFGNVVFPNVLLSRFTVTPSVTNHLGTAIILPR